MPSLYLGHIYYANKYINLHLFRLSCAFISLYTFVNEEIGNMMRITVLMNKLIFQSFRLPWNHFMFLNSKHICGKTRKKAILSLCPKGMNSVILGHQENWELRLAYFTFCPDKWKATFVSKSLQWKSPKMTT